MHADERVVGRFAFREGLEHERHVDLVVVQHLRGVVILAEDRGDDEARVRASQVRDGRREQRVARRRERQDAHPTGASVANVGERLLRTGDRARDVVRVLGEQESGVGRADAAAVLLEQGHTGLALEGRHLLAHRRGRVAEPGRGGGDRAGVDDGVEDLEAA